MKNSNYSRRRFLSEAAKSLGSAEFALLGLMNTSFIGNNNKKIMQNNYENPFESIKQINAGPLNVRYVQAGPLTSTSI